MATISMSSIATAWKGKIVWSYTQDINSNMSTVHAVVSTWKTDSSPSSSASGAYFSGTLYVGDRSIGFSFQQQNAASEGNPQYQAELEVPIVHKNDGSASVYIYCQIDAPAGVSMYNKPLKGGGTYSLATIPRESSITAAGDMYFGSPCSITWTPASSSFHYKIKMSVGSWSHTTSVISPNTTNSYTYDDYTIPLDLASQFPDSNSGIINVSLYSYSDKSCQTQVGSVSTASFTVLIPSNVVPRITSYSASFDNSTNDTINSWGVGLVGYSAVKLTASAVGSNGSTISSFEITGSYEVNPIAKYQNEEDKTNAYLEYTGSVFATSGNKEFTIRCVDSRGRKSNPIEIKNMISVLPYTKPNVLSVSVTKDDRGTSNAEDDKMVVTAVWEYDPISHNGVNHNYASGVVYYKESNATTWTPHPGTIYNNIPFMLYDMTLRDTKSYNIKVVVTDAVGGYGDKSAFSSTAQVLLDFRSGGKGLGIGKICENDGMEVLMDSTFYNEIFLMRESNKYDIDTYIKLLAKEAFDSQKSSLFGEIYPIGSIYTSILETSPKDLFGVGDWDRIKDVFLFGAIDLSDLEDPNNMDDPETRYLPGEQWGEKEHTLTVDELPKHCHWGVTRPDYSKKAGTHPSPVMNGINDNFPETDDEGENQPHNNMPPYLAVYMWKRVA